ncbi:MAG: TlpA family protein disulfide reductase [Bacteroidales bacterium]|nr:TlpA family protein disulfide reductase [Bacteroidales bacterium]
MRSLLIATMLMCSVTLSAQRTIENPFFAIKNASTIYLDVEKIVLKKDQTKLYMVYSYRDNEATFNMNGDCYIATPDGKKLQVLSAEGIELNGPFLGSESADMKKHFVLNFPPLPADAATINFIEGDEYRCFKIHDIALTDKAASEMKSRYYLPDEKKNYAASIKDNGQSLEEEEFTTDSATVRGHVYGADPRLFGETVCLLASVYINNALTEQQETYSTIIDSNGNYELKIPMTVKHQTVLLALDPFTRNENVVISANKTVVADFYMRDLFLKPNKLLMPYFSGENVDLNFALQKDLHGQFYDIILSDSTAIVTNANCTADEYKDRILKTYYEFCERIDTMNVTKRAKELLKINLKSETAYCLSMGHYFTEEAYREVNNKHYPTPIPEYNKPNFDKEYYKYPKLLELDNMMMFYAKDFSYCVFDWELGAEDVTDYYNKESIFDDQSQRDAALEEYRTEVLGSGDSYFKDLIVMQEACSSFKEHDVVSDSLVSVIEKLRFGFYADYVKHKNAMITAKKEAERKRGGYFEHKAGESECDSVLVEIMKDFKGKVVIVDFWNTWCNSCIRAMREEIPLLTKHYAGKDVEFLFLADESSPLNSWNALKQIVKGHHYRITENQMKLIMSKWDLTGFPSFVILGKDGIAKKCLSAHGLTHETTLIDEELKK